MSRSRPRSHGARDVAASCLAASAPVSAPPSVVAGHRAYPAGLTREVSL